MNRWRDALRDKRVAISGSILLILAIAAFGAPPLAALIGLDPGMVDLYRRFAAPSLVHSGRASVLALSCACQ